MTVGQDCQDTAALLPLVQTLDRSLLTIEKIPRQYPTTKTMMLMMHLKSKLTDTLLKAGLMRCQDFLPIAESERANSSLHLQNCSVLRINFCALLKSRALDVT
mmetsp:Transcript_524/g.1126  ORF Transcript_524/g.1126 Transcript_524/m.1126 type:complete len:103 (-) Transcript_524:7-315(-)